MVKVGLQGAEKNRGPGLPVGSQLGAAALTQIPGWPQPSESGTG